MPFDTDQQIKLCKWSTRKGDAIVQSIIPIHMMATPQAQELTAPMTEHII